MNTARINEGSVGTRQVAPFVYRDTRYTGIVTSSQLPSYVYVHLKRIRGNVVRNYMPGAYIQRTERGTGALINARISYADSPF